MPWEARAVPAPDRDYVAVVTYLPMRRVLALPRWFGSIRAVQKQLERTPGLVGYSLRLNPLRLEFWTLSLWEDEHSLGDFLRELPHADVMRRFGSKLSRFGTRQWTIAGSQAPPSWQDGLSRF